MRGCGRCRRRARPEVCRPRWSAGRKGGNVLPQPPGRDIGQVSGRIRVPQPKLARGQRMFLEGDREESKRRTRRTESMWTRTDGATKKGGHP